MFNTFIQKLQTKEGLFGVLSFAIVIITIGFMAQGFSFTKNPHNYPGAITVTGTAEMSASPDIARFSFSVTQDAKTVADARSLVADITNPLLEKIRGTGVLEKDIKTIGFNVYPKYEYRQETRCLGTFCPPWNPGKQELVGFTYTINYQVTVRDLDKVSGVGTVLTDAKVSTVDGPMFAIDDQEALKRKITNDAIRDAKSQAKQLARGLGVRLGKITDFQIVGNDPYAPMYAERDMMLASAVKSVPEMPTGEQDIKVQVLITYRLK